MLCPTPLRAMMVGMREDPVSVLQRWEESGAHWRVVGRSAETVTIALLRCDAGEEVDRLVSNDPQLRTFLRERGQ